MYSPFKYMAWRSSLSSFVCVNPACMDIKHIAVSMFRPLFSVLWQSELHNINEYTRRHTSKLNISLQCVWIEGIKIIDSVIETPVSHSTPYPVYKVFLLLSCLAADQISLFLYQSWAIVAMVLSGILFVWHRRRHDWQDRHRK